MRVELAPFRPDQRALVLSWLRSAEEARQWASLDATDDQEHEAELARLIVDPDRRGRGLGRRLVAQLAVRAAELGFDEVWLRVAPDNEPAIACYQSAGFVRATAAQEQEFNTGQPQRYLWMRAPRRRS